jgi:glutathione synthase
MKTYTVLILTDHTSHTKGNSVYSIADALSKHALVSQLDIATKGNSANHDFFLHLTSKTIWATKVKESFEFSEDGFHFKQNLEEVPISKYDLIWLRLPPPIDKSFLAFLAHSFPTSFIINNPSGIYETGSKAFLMNFQKVCPPMKICTSIEDIVQFKNQFPIVLKPFREYGGKGIVRIDGEKVWVGNTAMTFNEFKKNLEGDAIAFLGVKFLKKVKEGDKRIIVVNGKIVGASLRLPAQDSWICNIAMGGSSHTAEVDQEEYEIVETINPILSEMGVVMYGVDTLMGDHGKRVLSEINTTSIGGLAQLEKQRGLPVVAEAVELVIQYFLRNVKQLD